MIMSFYKLSYNFIFLEKAITQGKKRSLEPDNDTKSSSPPKVSIIQFHNMYQCILSYM